MTGSVMAAIGIRAGDVFDHFGRRYRALYDAKKVPGGNVMIAAKLVDRDVRLNIYMAPEKRVATITDEEKTEVIRGLEELLDLLLSSRRSVGRIALLKGKSTEEVATELDTEIEKIQRALATERGILTLELI